MACFLVIAVADGSDSGQGAVCHLVDALRGTCLAACKNAGGDFSQTSGSSLPSGTCQCDWGHSFGHGAALHDHVLPFTAKEQGFFFKVGFFHQPMGKAAQQFHLWAAAVIAARPEPAMVRQKLRDAAFAHTAQHQQRFAVRAIQQRVAYQAPAVASIMRNQRPQVSSPSALRAGQVLG